MFLCDSSENIRKPLVSCCFQGGQKEILGRKGLKLQETESIVNITKLRLNLYISFILELIPYKYFPYFYSLVFYLKKPCKKPSLLLHTFILSKKPRDKVILSEKIFILPYTYPVSITANASCTFRYILFQGHTFLVFCLKGARSFDFPLQVTFFRLIA